MSKVKFQRDEIARDGSYKLPFGKHQGEAIEDVPSGYLRWLSSNSDRDALIWACNSELAYRDKHACHFGDEDDDL